MMIHSLTNTKNFKPETQEMVVLSMPNNSSFHGVVQKVEKDQETIEMSQFHADQWYLLFERSDYYSNVKVNGENHVAVVYDYIKIFTKP